MHVSYIHHVRRNLFSKSYCQYTEHCMAFNCFIYNHQILILLLTNNSLVSDALKSSSTPVHLPFSFIQLSFVMWKELASLVLTVQYCRGSLYCCRCQSNRKVIVNPTSFTQSTTSICTTVMYCTVLTSRIVRTSGSEGLEVLVKHHFRFSAVLYCKFTNYCAIICDRGALCVLRLCVLRCCVLRLCAIFKHTLR